MQRMVARSRLRQVLRTGAPLLLIGLLASCMLPPQPVTEVGRDVFNLYVVILILAAIVFVAVEGFILYAVVRYRRQPGDDTLPEQLHGNTTVEIIWTLIPTVIVFILFGVSMVSLAEVEARADHPGVVVQVDGFQWNWTFRYQDGPVVDSEGGEPAVLTVPVGEPVHLVLNSLDVNHAFYVPQFLIKRDLINLGENGRDNELEFTITDAGTYAGQCAEFCGTNHADMKFVVEAISRADYDAYITAWESGETPAPSAGGECSTTIEIKASNLAFDIDSFEVPAETDFCINFENQDDIPHDVAIYDGGDELFKGDPLNEAGSITYHVPGLPAGDYRFHCDFHPQDMVGDVSVTQ
jgi:cytochrome c oxidase subunit II